MAQDSNELRQRRYRLHKSGIHDMCKPDRECRSGTKAAPIVVEPSPPCSPREATERELSRTIARLDVLHAALAERPTDVALLAEARGQQRALTSLAAALARTAPPAQVVQLKNPLDALRRRRAERQASP